MGGWGGNQDAATPPPPPPPKKKDRERGSCRVGGKEEGESRNLKVVREGEI